MRADYQETKRAGPGHDAGPPDRGDAWEPPGPHNIDFDPSELEGGKAPEPRFRFLTAAEFDAGNFQAEWLVKNTLVKGEPAVMAGLSKTLKTSIGVDLCVSLAGGGKFLGKHEVPRRVKVAIVSGESGKSTLQDAARRISHARGLNHAKLNDQLHWCFDLPVLSDLAGMGEFVTCLADRGVEVVLIDPLYLAMGDVDMRNMFQAGAVLRNVAKLLLDRGVTPIILHHANRQVQPGEPMELTHIAYSGVDQFARQFMLISRREKYTADGVHKLWLQVGGSAFTGCLWAVDVDEGKADENFKGRRWDVTVQTASEATADQAESRVEARDERKRAAELKADAEVLRGIDAETDAGRPAASRRALREFTGFDYGKLYKTVDRLLADELVEEHEFVRITGNKTKANVKGLRRLRRDDAGMNGDGGHTGVSHHRTGTG